MNPREAAAHHRRRAQAALDIGRYAQAEREAREALSYGPADDDALVLLGRAQLGVGAYEHALDAANEAVRVAPRRGYCHFLVGYTLQCLGRYEDAIEPLRQAITLEPGFARYHARLALSFAETKRTAESAAECEKSLEMGPRDTIVLENVSRAFGAAGQLGRAEDIARELVKLEPESASSFGRLAWVLAERKSYEEAAKMARESLRIDPNNYAAWANLGYAEMERGANAAAEEATREALRLRPGLASATTNLVAILRRRRANAEAARVLSEARARDPENKSFREQHAEVRKALSQEASLRWTDRVVLTVVVCVVALPLALAFPEVSLVVAAVAFALAWYLWKLK